MQEIANRTYGMQRLPIDGTRFRACVFTHTKLIFTASDRVEFVDCTFNECDWVFEGSALITLQLLSGLYKGLGLEGEKLVDRIVADIKTGRLGLNLHVPTAAAVA